MALEIKTDYIPPQHGFRFVNRFELDLDFHFPMIGSVDLANLVYGMCGGMCFSSLDYFNEGVPVPEFDRVEDLDVTYLRYLWDRQMDSMGFTVVANVLRWMLRDDAFVGQSMIRTEIPRLRRQLEIGRPVVLALIRAQGFGNPTLNHQVLATGYTFDPVTQRMSISLYDPNHPGGQPTLDLNLSRMDVGLDLSQSTGEALRGFFAIRYRQQALPA